jgi:hypothetical protein
VPFGVTVLTPAGRVQPAPQDIKRYSTPGQDTYGAGISPRYAPRATGARFGTPKAP